MTTIHLPVTRNGVALSLRDYAARMPISVHHLATAVLYAALPAEYRTAYADEAVADALRAASAGLSPSQARIKRSSSPKTIELQLPTALGNCVDRYASDRDIARYAAVEQLLSSVLDR